MSYVRSAVSWAILLSTASALASKSVAQSLPEHALLNPTATSRSGLYVPPFADPAPGRWRGWSSVQYGSAVEIEYDPLLNSYYLLDAELLRLAVGVRRDLSPSVFVTAEVGAGGSYDGFADGFFDWYHDLIGYRARERRVRPTNQYAYRFELAGGPQLTVPASSFALADTRLAVGLRHSSRQQTAVSLTLPTATGGGFGRGTVSASAIHTVRLPLLATVDFEGSFGVGVTPRHGPLAPVQRTAFVSGSGGVRWRVWGRNSLYGYLFYHSPYYRRTGFRTLDRRELTVDFGWIAREESGAEWHVGFTENIAPDDQGIDLIMKVGRSW